MHTLANTQRPQQQGTPPTAEQQAAQGNSAQHNNIDKEKIYQWILELSNSTTRENALLELR